MNSSFSFAAFVMTYERPSVLEDTISKMFRQSFPPEKILIVDNSATDTTADLTLKWNNPRIEYFKVGYNSGPAGAAKIGLKKLASEGYQWIYWGDDNDPPHFQDGFEKLIAIGNVEPSVGILGAVGQYFNPKNGELFRVPDASLTGSPILEVDSIAGGQCMIINAEVVRRGCLPNERLFFGFEELDYCLKVKKLGYRLIVSTDLFLESRKKFKKLNFNRSGHVLRKPEALKREYYSVRNMLIILRENSMYGALFNRFFVSIARGFYGFSKGIGYGLVNLKFVVVGLWHGLIGKAGRTY